MKYNLFNNFFALFVLLLTGLPASGFPSSSRAALLAEPVASLAFFGLSGSALAGQAYIPALDGALQGRRGGGLREGSVSAP